MSEAEARMHELAKAVFFDVPDTLAALKAARDVLEPRPRTPPEQLALAKIRAAISKAEERDLERRLALGVLLNIALSVARAEDEATEEGAEF